MLEAITITRPSVLESTADQLEQDIYKEEACKYVKEKKALERVTKQAYSLVWGQCSIPMKEKLWTVDEYDTFSADKDMIE
eukprot:7606358-Ditylum_brightwellii.AAC.1